MNASRSEVADAVREWWKSLDMQKMEVTMDDLPRRFDVAFMVKEGGSFILPSVKVLTYIILEEEGEEREEAGKGPEKDEKKNKMQKDQKTKKGKNRGSSSVMATRVICEALLPYPVVGINGVRYLKLSLCWLKRYFTGKGIRAELSTGFFEQRVRCD